MRRRRRDDAGSIAPLIIGFAVVIALLVAVVVDASAAYLRREELDAVADAAALAATDGLQGDAAYTQGLSGTLTIDPDAARAYVEDYLRSSGALDRLGVMTWTVAIVNGAVVVQVRAPMDLPLRVPGVGDHVPVSGSAAAVVAIGE
ncbi:MAG TPA: pilus assembly protein TadG-related protein [Marmoricola sp.]|nr:pilus assembly protein TadG-related protein [Marmoricola sp.]